MPASKAIVSMLCLASASLPGRAAEEPAQEARATERFRWAEAIGGRRQMLGRCR